MALLVYPDGNCYTVLMQFTQTVLHHLPCLKYSGISYQDTGVGFSTIQKCSVEHNHSDGGFGYECV